MPDFMTDFAFVTILILRLIIIALALFLVVVNIVTIHGMFILYYSIIIMIYHKIDDW